MASKKEPECLQCLQCRRLQKQIDHMRASAMQSLIPDLPPVVSMEDVKEMVDQSSQQLIPRIREFITVHEQLLSDYDDLVTTHEEEIEDRIEDRVEEALERKAFLEEVAADRQRLSRRAS